MEVVNEKENFVSERNTKKREIHLIFSSISSSHFISLVYFGTSFLFLFIYYIFLFLLIDIELGD